MTTRLPHLTLMLGAGGVGKTTLAAALGLAHARAGKHAALLGVDPARRLRSALALPDVPELGVAVPVGGTGSLEVALLDPSACLRRWVSDACTDDERRARLFANPFFGAIADHLAGFTDAIGCVRAVEWAERAPQLTELLLDTAPGMPSVELLARPDKLMAFFDGRLIRWLVRLARPGKSVATRLGRQIFGGLADLSGAQPLRDFGELMSALDVAIATMVVRLEHARAWLREASTSIVIVCGVSDDAAHAARALDRAVRELGFTPRLIVLNRVLPASLDAWSPRSSPDASARAFARYVRGYCNAQQRVRAEISEQHVPVLEIPDAATLDLAERLEGLAALGEPLREAIMSSR